MRDYDAPVRAYVNSLADVLGELTGFEMDGTYAASGGGTLHKRDELGVSRMLSENLLGVYSFTNDYFYNGGDSFSDAHSSRIVSSILHLPEQVRDDQNFELGFGMGNGFQLYCDNTMILTSGGGGGGGIYWNSEEEMTTFGGGGGGGVQLLSTFGQKQHHLPSSNIHHFNETGGFVSIGGGGGCGTCPENNRTSSLCSKRTSAYQMQSRVICGDSSDKDAISKEQFQHILKTQFNTNTFQKYCTHVSVFGGGGAGGGEVTCRHENGGGFGFYFHLNSKPTDEDDSKQHKHRVREVPYQEGSEAAAGTNTTSNTTSESDWVAYRDFGQLVQAAVGRCEGYSNWACVCAKSRVILHDCAKYNTVDNGDGEANGGEISGGANVTVASEVPDWSAVNCTTFNHYNVSFHRILESSCSSFPSSLNSTNYSSENDSNSDSATNGTQSVKGCGSTDNIVFTTLKTLPSGSTHNITFYAGKTDTNRTYLHNVLSSYPEFVSSTFASEPLLGSFIAPVVTQGRISTSWVFVGACCVFTALLLFVVKVRRYAEKAVHRNHGYVEIV